jgi:hypothetical protein
MSEARTKLDIIQQDILGDIDTLITRIESLETAEYEKINYATIQLSEVYKDLDKIHKEIFRKSEEFQRKSAEASANLAIEHIRLAEEVSTRNIELAEKVAIERTELAGEEAKARAEVWAEGEKVSVKQVIAEVVQESLCTQIETASASLSNNKYNMILLILFTCIFSSIISEVIMLYMTSNDIIPVRQNYNVDYQALAAKIIEAMPKKK